jgi:oligopeptide/dipeptide ABC transporter ATP-binding protein
VSATEPAPAESLVEVSHLKQYFPIKDGILLEREVARVHAVDDVSLSIRPGETFGLVGESGCGKSTLSRAILRLLEPTDGTVTFDGQDITKFSRRQMRPLRREMQMIFQDPFASLNPRKRIGQIVGDPIRLHGKVKGGEAVTKRVQELLDRVGLHPEHYNRFPHEFSGGQRQRIGVARALALEPRLIVADEPVSALDVSIQAQIINLLDDLQDEYGLTYLFVAHDLGVVRHVSDRVGVMYLGKIVEVSPAAGLYDNPMHPYTVALLSAIPIPDPRENRSRVQFILEGDLPSPIDPPPACRFHTRCPRARAVCAEVEPPLVDYGGGHRAACHFPVGVSAEQLAGAKIAPDSPASAGDQIPAPENAGRSWDDGPPPLGAELPASAREASVEGESFAEMEETKAEAAETGGRDKRPAEPPGL